MKNSSLILFISMMLYSCDVTNQKNKELEIKKITQLNKRIKKKEKTIDSIIFINCNIQTKLDEYNKEYISRKTVLQLLNFVHNKELIGQHIVNRVKEPIKQSDFTFFNIHNSVSIINRYNEMSLRENNNLINNKDFILKNLTLKLNRTPDGIKKLFDDNKNIIIDILKKNRKFYKDCGLKLFIKCLILSYEESIDEKDKFKELLEVASSDEYKGTLEGGKHVDIANLFTTENFNDLFKVENLDSSYETIYEEKDRFVFYVYSFWARRINEKNENIVYEILTEIDSNIE